MIPRFKNHDDIPTSVADFVLTASGETNIKQVPLKDINERNVRFTKWLVAVCWSDELRIAPCPECFLIGGPNCAPRVQTSSDQSP